mmetsp:Transcript_41100/g.65041  ORF Transcript_41100/g.65041 Transcript_41100/m.65041 type:complete len:234 (+) Transcript_41100:687-1388(+)
MWKGSTSGLIFPMAPSRQTSQSAGSSSMSFKSLSLKPSTKRTSSSSTTTAGNFSLTIFCQILRWLKKHPIIPFVQSHLAENVATFLSSSGFRAFPSVPENRSTCSPSRANSTCADSQRCGLRSKLTTKTFGTAFVVPLLLVSAGRTHLPRLETSALGCRRDLEEMAARPPPARPAQRLKAASPAKGCDTCGSCPTCNELGARVRGGALAARNASPKALKRKDMGVPLQMHQTR